MSCTVTIPDLAAWPAARRGTWQPRRVWRTRLLAVMAALCLTAAWLLIQQQARSLGPARAAAQGEVLVVRMLPWDAGLVPRVALPTPPREREREPQPLPVRPPRQAAPLTAITALPAPAPADARPGVALDAPTAAAPVAAHVAAEPADPGASVPALQRFRYDPSRATTHAAAAVTRSAQHPELTPTAKLERDVKASVKPSCTAPNATKNMPVQLGGVLNAPVLAAAIIMEKCSW